MRLLHGADFHLGVATYGRTVDEFGQTLLGFVDLAREHSVDVAVIAGDLFNSRRPGPAEILYAVKALRSFRDAGIEVVIGPGNHDGAGTIGDPDSHTLAWMAELALDGVHVATGPEIFEVDGACFAVLPYAHKRSVESGDSLADRTAEASRILEQTINDMYQRQKARGKGVPNIFVGHLTTSGASLGSEAAMQLGWDTTVDPAVFEPFEYAALGHIHVPQRVSRTAWYAGSPDVHGFGEEAAGRGFLLVEVKAGLLPEVQTIESHPRQFIVVRREEGSAFDLATMPTGAVVRLEYGEPVAASMIASDVKALRDAGASYVRVVPAPPAENRYRNRQGVSAESSLDDQMAAWLESQDVEHRELVLKIAGSIVDRFRAE